MFRLLTRAAIALLVIFALALVPAAHSASLRTVNPPGKAPPIRTHGPDTLAVSEATCLLIILCPSSPTPVPSTTGPTWACTTDNYFVAVLVGNGTRSTADSTKISKARSVIASAGQKLMAGAQESGGPIPRLKFQCDTGGLPTIRWGFSAPVNASFSTVYQSLYNQGLGRKTNEKFMIFYDGSVSGKCGVSTGDGDPQPGPENRSNIGPEWSMMYSNCWSGQVGLHELTHAMGAVNPSAPYYLSYNGGHCKDEVDVMCYGPGMLQICPSPERYDCRHDTYFDTKVESGEWLATHWNLGSPNNRWLRFP